MRHPAFVSCLERHSRLAGRCPNSFSLFPPLAAVVAVAACGLLQITFSPKGSQQETASECIGAVFQKTQYFLKKGLHFAGQSVTIVKLIILIPYFTAGGASTMAKCECCGKGVTFGIKVSHSHRRSNRTWKPNVRRVKAVVEGSPKYVYACSRCLRAGKVTRAV